MPRRSVVLGLPLTLGLRAANMFGRLPSAASKIPTAVTALAVATPWISESLKSVGSSTNAGVEGTAGADLANLFGSFLSFVDMNAQMVTITEKRRMVVVSIPGREADYLQDLGGHSVKYRLSGKFFDQDPSYDQNLSYTQQILQTFIRNGATGNTQLLRLLMRTASPVPFMCEHEIAMVVITDFKFSMIAGEPRWVNYDMDLIEYTRIPYLAKMAMLGGSNLVEELT